MNKSGRIRRATLTRSKIARLGAVRLCIHRSSQHIYAQLIAANRSEVLASASTAEKGFKKYGGNIEAAQWVGKTIAERSAKAGHKKVAFDRSGFKYHGRVKALADAARENGLEF